MRTDVCDDQADGEADRGAPAETGPDADGQERHPDGDRHDGDDPRRPSYLGLQRAGLRGTSLRQRGDAAEFGVHAGAGHDGGGFAAGAGGAAEDQVVGVEQ
ncbi:hypothetical protein FB565_006150 [Actinoplanes lutulentus]|nr:hypothetical protein [Actinoplanes lutulentus]